MSQQEGQRGPLGTTSFISKHQGNWPLIFSPPRKGSLFCSVAADAQLYVGHRYMCSFWNGLSGFLWLTAEVSRGHDASS